jgi:hypothetical protein
VLVQAITYRGRTVAAATRSRFFLADELDRRAISDPERTFVIFMCAYAGDVARVIWGRLGRVCDVSGRRCRGRERAVISASCASSSTSAAVGGFRRA